LGSIEISLDSEQCPALTERLKDIDRLYSPQASASPALVKTGKRYLALSKRLW